MNTVLQRHIELSFAFCTIESEYTVNLFLKHMRQQNYIHIKIVNLQCDQYFHSDKTMSDDLMCGYNIRFKGYLANIPMEKL